MQVQHEAQLIEPHRLRGESFFLTADHLSPESYALAPLALAPIQHLASSPSRPNMIAIHLSQANQIVLIDSKSSTRRDRFPLKSCDKKFSRQSFTLTAMCFSPDGSRLAVGQSDCIIYIYRLSISSGSSSSSQAQDGQLAGGSAKPTITGKFTCSSPITCLIWTEIGLMFGSQDGKVKLISLSAKSTSDNLQQSQTSSAKVLPLYSSQGGHTVISLAFKSPILAVGQVDSSIVLLTVTAELLGASNDHLTATDLVGGRRNSAMQLASKTVQHSCPPNCLSILQTDLLCCAGFDGRLALHSVKMDSSPLHMPTKPSSASLKVNWLQNIDLREDIVALDYSTSNEVLVMATTTRLMFAKYNQDSVSWQLQQANIELANTYGLTGVVWTCDGSQLLAGTSRGSLELFKCVWQRQSINEQLDICHIARNRVRLTDRARNLLATYRTQQDIKRVNLLGAGRNVIIWTANSLLLARLGQPAQSELSLASLGRGEKSAKFCFHFEGFVLIHINRELLVVRLGENSVIYETKLDYICRDIVSARMFPPIQNELGNQARRAAANSAKTSDRLDETVDLTESPTKESSENNSSPSKQAHESICERLVHLADGSAGKNMMLVDLKLGSAEMSLQHDSQIDWLELSHSGNFLAFRDSLRRLHLLQLGEGNANGVFRGQIRQLVDGDCEFVRWIEGSDALVVQMAHLVKIWYSVKDQEKVRTLDCRAYNVSNTKPLVDLSLSGQEGRAYPRVVRVEQEHLRLSNGFCIPLDRVRVRFSSAITNGSLEAALEVLQQSEANKRGLSDLWSQLGWLAIDADKCELAIEVFGLLEHRNLVNHLRELREKSQEERMWRLATLRGDWSGFERLADPETITTTYRRLNKWSRMIEYLTRTQQYRQRDLAERDQCRWLVDRGRHMEAARLQAKSGDLVGALELLMGAQKVSEAAVLLLEELKVPIVKMSSNNSPTSSRLLEIAKSVKLNLIHMEEFAKSARICAQILDEANEALELYLKGKEFESALEVANTCAPERLDEIRRLYANHLCDQWRSERLSRRQALKAVDLLMASNCTREALKVAVELKDIKRAHQLLFSLRVDDGHPDELLQYHAEVIGSSLLADGLFEEAIEALLVGRQYTRVVEMQLERGNYREAFEVSREFVHSSDLQATNKQFLQLANELRASGKVEEAERMYLLLDEDDLAIEMLRGEKKYERLIELVSERQPDKLEETLMLSARDFESAGDLESAEKYLLRASAAEWTSVVRMYRLAGRWADAYRVARANCSSARDPLLVQLAYWWAKSLGDQQAARELLAKELKLLDDVVEFCCVNKNFQLALDVTTDREQQQDIAKRYAAHLERHHKFAEAERVLVQCGRVEEAAQMYLDNDMHSEAIRLVESKLAGANNGEDSQRSADLLKRTLVRCANSLAESAEPAGKGEQMKNGLRTKRTLEALVRAQQLYLRAQQPELAVEMYRARGMWQEAVRVAHRFAPHLLEALEGSLDAQVSGDVASIVDAVRRTSSLSSSRTSSRSSSAAAMAASEPPVSHTANPIQTEGSSTAADYLKRRAEAAMRAGDLQAARLALGKFVDSLTDNSVGQLAQLADQLTDLERLLSAGSNLPVSEQVISRMVGLANQVAAKCAWMSLDQPDERLQVWLRLRNALMGLMEAAEATQSPLVEGRLLGELDRRLLLAHYMSLQAALVSQLGAQLARAAGLKSFSLANVSLGQLERLQTDRPTANDYLALLADLWTSLLSEIDLLDPSAVLYNCARWLLASGRRSLADELFTLFVGLLDSQLDSRQLCIRLNDKQLIPPELAERTSPVCSANELSSAKQAEMRAWLLDGLMGAHKLQPGGQTNPPAHSLDRQSTARCLVSGQPIPPGADQLVLGERFGRSYQVSLSAWRKVRSLASRSMASGRLVGRTKTSKEANLRDSLEFISRLTGGQKSVGRLAGE